MYWQKWVANRKLAPVLLVQCEIRANRVSQRHVMAYEFYENVTHWYTYFASPNSQKGLRNEKKLSVNCNNVHRSLPMCLRLCSKKTKGKFQIHVTIRYGCIHLSHFHIFPFFSINFVHFLIFEHQFITISFGIGFTSYEFYVQKFHFTHTKYVSEWTFCCFDFIAHLETLRLINMWKQAISPKRKKTMTFYGQRNTFHAY